MKFIKKELNGRIQQYSEEFGLIYLKDKSPWSISADIAIPCATQNEINEVDAEMMIKNNIKIVVEGSNMPVIKKAIQLFQNYDILFIPGKIANSGGVIVSVLEKIQNSTYSVWNKNKVEKEMKKVMKNSYRTSIKYGEEKKKVNYVRGANIASFVKVADAVISQGSI